MATIQDMSEQIRQEYLDPVEREILQEMNDRIDKYFKPYLDTDWM